MRNGYIGKRKPIPLIIDGLKRLEYRGYDSSGVASVRGNDFYLRKSKGRDIDKPRNLAKSVTVE